MCEITRKHKKHHKNEWKHVSNKKNLQENGKIVERSSWWTEKDNTLHVQSKKRLAFRIRMLHRYLLFLLFFRNLKTVYAAATICYVFIHVRKMTTGHSSHLLLTLLVVISSILAFKVSGGPSLRFLFLPYVFISSLLAVLSM